MSLLSQTIQEYLADNHQEWCVERCARSYINIQPVQHISHGMKRILVRVDTETLVLYTMSFTVLERVKYDYTNLLEKLTMVINRT